MHDVFARQLGRNAWAVGFLTLMGRDSDGPGRFNGSSRITFRLIEQTGLQALLLLAGRAKLLMTQIADKFFELIDILFLLFYFIFIRRDRFVQ